MYRYSTIHQRHEHPDQGCKRGDVMGCHNTPELGSSLVFHYTLYKACTWQNTQNDRHKFLSDSSRVRQIRFLPRTPLRELTAPPDLLAGLRGPTSKRTKGVGRERRKWEGRKGKNIETPLPSIPAYIPDADMLRAKKLPPLFSLKLRPWGRDTVRSEKCCRTAYNPTVVQGLICRCC